MSSSSTAIMVEDDDDSNPPLMATYKHLFSEEHRLLDLDVVVDDGDHRTTAAAGMDDGGDGQQHRLPVIDLQHDAAEHCIVRAASEWGFFQVTNHGVPQALLDELHDAQVAVFRRPFDRKVREPLLGFSPESYRWGTPTATCLEQLSWSEAYHIPIMAAAGAAGGDGDGDKTRLVIEEVSTAMSKLALHLAGILIKRGGGGGDDDDDMMLLARCTRPDTCFLRLNRYPPCDGGGGGAFGLCPHTDSDVLTILHQDGVGGLQLLKSGRWLAMKPNPGALIVNVGDLLQAWSNDRYRSVEHRVVASAARQRFSVAFFLCPAYDTLIRPLCTASGDGGGGPPRYKSFTFGEYRNQVREDVRLTGRKLGLQRFRLHHQHLQDSKEAAAAHSD